VLIVDVLRPLPLSLHAANWMVTRVWMRRSEEAKKVMANIEKHS
jgi:hypothetical protein